MGPYRPRRSQHHRAGDLLALLLALQALHERQGKVERGARAAAGEDPQVSEPSIVTVS